MLYGISGGIGWGKTALAVALLYKAKKQGRPVFANIHTKFAKLIKADQLNEFKFPKHSAILLDELYTWLDSRLSQKRKNVALTHIVLQSRKRGFDIIYTVQLTGSVDLRVRRNTHILITAIAPFTYIMTDTTVYPPRIINFTWRNPHVIFDLYDTHEIVYPVE